MFHDRVSFGGVIIAIGILYLWLTEFPLKTRRGMGVVGFGDFRRHRVLQLSLLPRIWLSGYLARREHARIAAVLRRRDVENLDVASHPAGGASGTCSRRSSL